MAFRAQHPPSVLMAVPNVSEGRDTAIIRAISAAFSGEGGSGCWTFTATATTTARCTRSPARPARSRMRCCEAPPRRSIDRRRERRRHATRRGAASPRRRARRRADRLPRRVGPRRGVRRGARRRPTASARSSAVPGAPLRRARGEQRTRAELRCGGVARLAPRIADGGVRARTSARRGCIPRAGATLVAARAAAGRVQPAARAAGDRRRRAPRSPALIREGGDAGHTGVRAIGVRLAGDVAQVSMNIERPLRRRSRASSNAVARARARRQRRAGRACAALPRSTGFPDDLPMPGFDRART